MKKTQTKPKVQGKSLKFKIFVGVMVFLMIFIIGIVQPEFTGSNPQFIVIFIISLICGIVGGAVMQ